jgi:hypothetical protein
VVQASPNEAVVVSSSDSTRLVVFANAVRAKAGLFAIPQAKSLLADASAFADAAAQSLVPVRPLDHYGPIGFRFDQPVEMEVYLPKVGRVDPPEMLARAAVFERIGDRWCWVQQNRQGTTIRAKLTALNPLALLADPEPPTLKVLRPGQDGRVDAADPTLEAEISDPGSGIDPTTVKVQIDDQPVEHTLELSTGRLSARLPVDRTGERTVALAASDRAGNVVRTTARIVVPSGFGISELVPFPNPARLASLKGPADQVDLSIHDVAGRTVRRLEGTTLSGANTVDWPLDTDDGSPVASGVYLVRVVVTGQGQRAVARTKLAVIR